MKPTHARLPDDQAGILLHTLGLDQRHRDDWRNHYVTGSESEPVIDALVAAGLMYESRRPGFLPERDRVFMATERGKVVARVENRRINPDPPASRARYLKWLSINEVDPDLTFGEFLRRKLYRDGAYESGLRSMWSDLD